MPPRVSPRARQRHAKKQGKLFREELAQAANDVLSNGIIEHEHDIEVTQTPQARPPLNEMTSAGTRKLSHVRDIPVTKARNWEANMKMNRVEHPRPVGLQSPRAPAELKPAKCALCGSQLEPRQNHPTTIPRSATMAGQITMTPEELSLLVKHEVLRVLTSVGASAETMDKVVNDDWAFAEEDTVKSRKTIAEATGSSSSDTPAAQEKTTEETQYTTSTQEDAEDPMLQHLSLHEFRQMLHKQKTEEFEPKFPETSVGMEIKFPPNVKSLEHWGTAVVQQGKYAGKSYSTVFGDEDYKKWLTTHFATLKAPPIVDLAKYVVCRIKAEMDKAEMSPPTPPPQS